MRAISFTLAVLSLCSLTAAQDLLRPERVAAGPLVLEVRVTRTAQLFHVVDQLSNWHPSCNQQYLDYIPLDGVDNEMLALFRGLRSKKPYGHGLEEALYTPLDLFDALAAAVANESLTQAEAAMVGLVLEHFAERVDQLVEARVDELDRVLDYVDRQDLADFASRLSKFTGIAVLKVPAYLIASPSPGGGGMEGGVLRVEVGSESVPTRTIYHEVAHAFFLARGNLLAQTAEPHNGLSVSVFAEGLAFAVAPGLYDDGSGDPLGALVLADKDSPFGWNDSKSLSKRRVFGLALRPVLARALDKQSLAQFAPRARDIWLAIREVEEARPGPSLLTAGPGYEDVWERMLDSRYRESIYSFPHNSEFYRQNLARARAGDTFVMLVAADQEDRTIPADFREFCPVPPPELAKRLEAGEKLEEVGTKHGLRVVLLAAPTLSELEDLIANLGLLSVGVFDHHGVDRNRTAQVLRENGIQGKDLGSFERGKYYLRLEALDGTAIWGAFQLR